MKLTSRSAISSMIVLSLIAILTILSTRLRAETGACGGQIITVPFTDVSASNIFFCAIAEAYFSGLTNGTTATTYSPTQAVPREQMAAFVTRTLDQSLKRGSRRAALGQFWSISKPNLNGTGNWITGSICNQIKSDGEDVYVALAPPRNEVWRLNANNNQTSERLSVYTGVQNAWGIAITPNFVFVTGRTTPGKLYGIGRGTPSASVGFTAVTIGDDPTGVAYDGEKIWTANTNPGSVSTYNPNTNDVVNIVGFNFPTGILYDGAHIWVTNTGANTLQKLDPNGNVLQTIAVGASPLYPMFDGINIWVPNRDANSISVVRVKDASGNPLAQAFVIATLTGNGLQYPNQIAFDGQRVCVTNFSGNSLSLWKATDLTPLGSISTAGTFYTTFPFGVCSDGVDFWVSFWGGAGGGTFLKF